MAQIGLKYGKYSPIDENGKYTGAKTLGKLISSNVTPNVAESTLFGDDEIAENASVVTGGTVNTNVTEVEPQTYAEVLGHSYNETTNEIVRNSNDVAPFIGYGRVITKIVNNVLRYKAEFLSKVQFKSNLPEEKTKGENIEFGTSTLDGKFFTLPDGTWSRTAEFETVEAAQSYIDELMAPKED